MRRLLLAGAGHAHLALLAALKEEPLYGLRITLVSPRERQVYSGMLPGVVAGHYRREEAEIDVAALAERACVEFRAGAIARFDAQSRAVVLHDGAELAYDLASFNVGSRIDSGVTGAGYATAVKPFESLLERLGEGALRRIAVAGGGAGGVEIALALRYHGAAVTLYSDRALAPPALAQRVERVLRASGVDFRPGMAVSGLEPGPVVIAGAARQEFDLVLLATGAAPLPWLKSSGLERDERGFVAVRETLQSVSHPEVFASGDCASLEGSGVPKNGVYAVRQGEALVQTFRSLAQGQAPVAYRPQRRALLLMSYGRRRAIAQWGGWTAQGAWVWRWKNRIDRAWIRRLSGGMK
jgi:pyridine nucleotide-disulfide oxidoreductase family protein